MDREALELLRPTAASVLASALTESSIDAVQGMLLYLKRQQTLITNEGLSWLFQQLWKASWDVRYLLHACLAFTRNAFD